MEKHQKHTKLTRPDYGNFGREEWAILGTNCGAIQKLSAAIIEAIGTRFNLAYVDASHKSHDESTTANHGSTPITTYTDMIDYHRFDTRNPFDSFQYRQWFNAQDGVIINGNHFKAKNQIVVIDQKKKESLSRKLDRLTNVEAILFAEGETEVYDFLKNHLPNWEQLPTFQLTDQKSISQWLGNKLESSIAPLYGLVLAGGKSQRMGKDKAWLDYHGRPQVEVVKELLGEYCTEVFVSCRPEQRAQFSNYSTIPDTFTGLGPFGAIASAFRENPNAAWLVMAVDIPLADKAFLNELVEHRNPSKQATAFLNPATGFPDPLLTIWEPRSYPTLLQFLTQGYSCPRKTLINSDITLIETTQANKLQNVNHPDEYEALVGQLKG
jgi:molybdopterin-guanine dinucleotide biosynthesis protein A